MPLRHCVYDNLVQLVKDDDSAALKFFLVWERDRRACLSHRYNDGLTLLHQACLLAKLKAIRVLVECGCNVGARSSVGWTALHAAALSGCYDVVAYLVNTCAADVNAEDDMGCRPVDLTLEPQITTFLHCKSEELNAITAEENRTYLKISQAAFLRNGREKYPAYPADEETKSRRGHDGQINSNRRTNFLAYIRCRDDDLDAPSEKHARITNYEDLKASRLKEDDSDIDSGIYEDFVEVNDYPIRADVLRKPFQSKFALTRAKSSLV